MRFSKITTGAWHMIFFIACLWQGKNIYSQTPVSYDSVTVAVAPEYDKVGKFHRFVFGEGYRKLWAAPVKLRILHLAIEKGGLAILKTRRWLPDKITPVERQFRKRMGIADNSKIS